MRRIVARVEVDGREVEMVFLSNNLEWSAAAEGYGRLLDTVVDDQARAEAFVDELRVRLSREPAIAAIGFRYSSRVRKPRSVSGPVITPRNSSNSLCASFRPLPRRWREHGWTAQRRP